MSEENVQIVRTTMEFFNLEGLDAIIDRFDPSFETTTPPSLSVEPDTYRGPDGVRRWWDAWEGTIDALRFELDEAIDAGDRVVAVTRMVARSRTTGIEFEQAVTMVWTIRDGRAARLDAYPTREEGLRAAGVDG